jgi:rhodanese-related sulfurtransferase
MTRRALAYGAAALALCAAFAGSPHRNERAPVDVAALAQEVARETDHVTAIELAQWIRDRKPGLRVIDLRTAAEFAEYRIPKAERIAITDLPATRFASNETIVLVSDGGAHAAQAWVFLRTLGHARVFFLRGGLHEWLDDVMNPAQPSELTRYFGGMPRMGEPSGMEVGEESARTRAQALRRRGC